MPTTWGPPIPGRCLGCLYSQQTVQGTAVTPANPTGVTQFTVTSEAGIQERRALGSRYPICFKPGDAGVTFELQNNAVQTYDFIQYVQRVNGELPWLTLGFGVKFDGTPGTEWAWQVQDCKLARGSFGLSAGGNLTFNCSGTGGLITELSSFSPANVTDECFFYAHEAVLTRAGSAFEVVSWTENFDHNVQVVPVIHGTAPAAFARGWKYQTEGDENITGNFTLRKKTGIDLQADTISTFAAVLTLTSKANPSNIIKFTYTDMIFDNEAFEGAPDGATFTVQYRAKYRVISDS